MNLDEIKEELGRLALRRSELEHMLVEQSLPKSGKNACGAQWREQGNCGYCGSMTPAEAIRRMSTPGTTYSGADWKYGFPHKFYIGDEYPHKFYSSHLKDATLSELAEFNTLSRFYLGVAWTAADGQVRYEAVPGTQSYGKTIMRKEVAECLNTRQY